MDIENDHKMVNKGKILLDEESGESQEPVNNNFVSNDIADKLKKFDLLEGKILANEKNTMKQQKHKSVIEKYTSMAPQSLITPNSTEAKGQRNYFQWNLVGQIISRVTEDSAFIDIYYNAVNVGKRLIQNMSKYTLANMNHDGYVLASAGTVQTEDDYDDEEVEEEDKKARITYTSVVSDKQWTIVLKNGEAIESICMGTNWICAYTSMNNLRLFTNQGIEIFCISMDKPVVCICGYENLLAVVYHDSIPLLGHQSMHVRVYNIHNLKIEFEKPVPLTVNKKLTWFGFSEEGLIYTQDSEGIIRTLYNDIWMPVFEEKEGAKLWIIGVSENELRCVKLSFDETDPNPLSKLNPKRVNLKPVLMENFFEPILSKRLNLYQENFKKQHFGYLKEAGMSGKNDEKTVIRQGILDEKETRALTIETDKIKVDFVRKLLLQESFDKAIYIASQIETEDVFNKCIILMEKLGFEKQAKKAKEFA